uniref:Uncharacterized protein n=1 Tax=Globodera rostochiensis TaxID=31243 RepID=A0A914I7Y6_GLORO
MDDLTGDDGRRPTTNGLNSLHFSNCPSTAVLLPPILGMPLGRKNECQLFCFGNNVSSGKSVTAKDLRSMDFGMEQIEVKSAIDCTTDSPYCFND